MLNSVLNSIRGMVIHRTDELFETYRSVWNRSADCVPHVIVVPESHHDVSLAVQYAVEMNKSVCVRGGGHHFAGLAVQDDAVMIHMRGMNRIQMSPDRKSVIVGAGATIGELDTATQRHGLAVPTGTSSGTGVAGLALGGGLGHLRRQYGLTCDQLISARMVLANGNAITVSKDQNSDIFWGIRGGGGTSALLLIASFKFTPSDPKCPFLMCSIIYLICDQFCRNFEMYLIRLQMLYRFTYLFLQYLLAPTIHHFFTENG